MKLGGGASICGPNIHPALLELLKNTAVENNIAHQIAVFGCAIGADVLDIHTVRGGIISGRVDAELLYAPAVQSLQLG